MDVSDDQEVVKEEQIPVMLRLKKSRLETVDKLAVQNNRSRSNMMATLIEEALSAYHDEVAQEIH